MEEETRYTPTEQQLTHMLMIELLAHQFCFPVQWIKTQDAILRDFSTERLVEIGPTETLIGMAKKTIAAGDYDISDVALGLERQLLSYKKNADAIRYQYQANEDTALPSDLTAPEVSGVPASAQPAVPASPTLVDTRERAIPTQQASIPDKPVSAVDLVTVVVATALKKLPGDIAQDQTIKALGGGRSTIQNEIIGDLIEEFGSLPDRLEDIPLADLGKTLSDNGQGHRLGPCTSSLVGKMVSTKMPAGFGVTALRQYLASTWNFKPGMQDRTLLQALFRQPGTRLSSEKEAQSYLYDVAHEALQNIGVDPSSILSRELQPATGPVALSSEASDAIKKEQQERDRNLFRLYAKRVGHNVQSANAGDMGLKNLLDDLQGRVDAWSLEHGEEYERGISPMFDSKKARKYDSYWNWVIQDLYATYSSVSSGQIEKLEAQTRDGHGHFSRRVTRQLLDAIQHLLGAVKGITHMQIREVVERWLLDLQKACTDASSQKQPIFRHSVSSTVPVLEISVEGIPSVTTKPRLTRHLATTIPTTFLDAVSETGSASPSSFPESSIHDAVFSLQPTIGNSPAESVPSDPQSTEAAYSRLAAISLGWTPEVQTKSQSGWCRNDRITATYLSWFLQASSEGISLHEKSVLVTGAGRNSIGSEIVALCLSAGAMVLVTTSSYSKETVDYYQGLYRSHGARDSQLVVVPWNGGSYQDVRSLVRYVYEELGWDPDHVIPFAAMGEAGRAIDELDDRSELAHRIMLTNLLRLLGSIKAEKAQRRIRTHPTHVILPLSPNHGSFGQDGTYAESKLGLEALLNKWWSEDWQEYLTLCGAVIGWTRGTGLMNSNDVLATGLEKDVGIRTFSSTEMAWHLVGLMDARLVSFCDTEPIKADLSGGLTASMNLKSVLKQIQHEINSRTDIQRALYREQQEMEHERAVTVPIMVSKKARIRVESMNLPEWEEIQLLSRELEGMVDLNRVVVVVGFGEAGPCGSTRTRWEAECSGTFSIDGCLELAWIMGLVKYHNGSLQGKDYCGWIDIATKQPISDADIKVKYEGYIIQHTGIRVVERQQHDLTTPDQQPMLCEVAIAEDLEPFEVSLEIAQDLQREHGEDNVFVGAETTDGQVLVTLRAGTTLFVPRAAKFHHAVGAQMPSGWDARTYGIPEDVIAQVDPVTLYALVATVEAFLSSGITDTFELFDHIHVGELGNAISSGLGGQRSLHALFKQRFLGRQASKDVLAETFVNTAAAWINMLLCGASGPIRTPVGACATALESVDTGFDLLSNGRAKAVLVGGTDALERDIAYEFANMQATINADVDTDAGRTPKEASRPTTTTRAGFVEGEGCGVQLLTTAQLALDMGLPIRAVVALSHTASDKIGRSVPAPGKGILTIAAEKRDCPTSPLIDLSYRRLQLDHCLRQIQEKRTNDFKWLDRCLTEACVTPNDSEIPESTRTDDSIEAHRQQIDSDAQRSINDARYRYGNGFWRDEPSISPLRGALSVWGLSIDDLDVASLHGTSTQKNDTNETAVLQSQLKWLGRMKGNLLPCISQKSLLGHGKGASGAFALNGCLQILRTGLIPGNRNADNIDSQLQDHDLLFFPSQTYKSSSPVKAFSVTSFGFGQKGAQVIGVNASYLFATIGEQKYKTYKAKVRDREHKANKALQSGILGGRVVNVKERSIYTDDKVEDSLLNRSFVNGQHS